MIQLADFKKELVELGVQDSSVVHAIVSYEDLKRYGFFADEYVDMILNSVSAEATLAMNCFTWEFCRSGSFHINTTPGEVGLIPEVFRRMDGVVRSQHPIYSLCAKGPRAKEFMAHTGTTCWGEGTPFESLTNANALAVLLGAEFPKGNTFFHSFEEAKQVPYRYFKEFSGTVNFGSHEEQYSTKFFVRKDDATEYSWQPAVDVLRARNLLQELHNPVPASAVCLRDLQEVVFELLDKNKEVFVVK
jgi:aminoglycoside 3-N-acetyltransferase